MFLSKENLKDAAMFTNGGLWADFKRALEARRPPAANAGDVPSTAAHQMFLRRGYEMAIEDIEKLPREIDPAAQPAIPPSILDTRD
jgi:hypothetical protein